MNPIRVVLVDDQHLVRTGLRALLDRAPDIEVVGEAGDGGSGPAPEERLPGNVLSEVVVPRKITVHLGRPATSARNVTVSFQSYIANVASSEVYPTWVGHAVYSAPLPRRASRACTAAKSARETSPSWVPGTTIHCDRGSRTLRADL